MSEFALGIGSNQGNRMNNILEGIRYLLSRPRMGQFRLSGVYESPPIEGVEGGKFLNCVFAGLFYGPPEELHTYCRGAEVLMGSTVNKQNSARTLDMDLLFFGDVTLNDNDLTLPHPGIRRRRFVLKPLSDIWKKKIPGFKATPKELLGVCSDKSRIHKTHDIPPQGCFWEVSI